MPSPRSPRSRICLRAMCPMTMPAMPAMKKLETTPKIEATSAMIASVLFGGSGW